MQENKLYKYFRKLVIALTLLFTFLLPVKLGGIVGVPEATSLFTDEFGAYIFITWPVFIFPLLSGTILLLALPAFPFKELSFKNDKLLLAASLWVLLAFTSLAGIVNATVWDFVIMEITHLFGLAAYVLTIYIFLKNVPQAKTLLTASILAGTVVTVCLGIEQYFSGFETMREYVANQEKITGTDLGVIKARIFDDRVHAPFTGSNSLAGYLLLTIPPALVTLWKLCKKIDPPTITRLIFIPIAAACLFFVFFATKARSAFLAVVLASGVSIIFFPVKKRLRRTIIILVPVVLIAGAFYIYEYGRGFQSMKVRIDYIIVSTELLVKQPLFGTGWGDFFYDYMQIKTIPSDEAPHTPHNLFLAMGGQAGILALLTSIGALFYPLWTGAKKVRELITEHKYLEEKVALLFGLTAFTFHTMLDIDLQVPGLIATAAALFMLVMAPEAKNELTASSLSCRISAFITAFIVAATAVTGGWHLVRSEYIYSKLEDICKLTGRNPQEIAAVNSCEVNEKLEAAVKARPYSPYPYSKAGAFYMATRRFESAEQCYRKALELAPCSAAYYFRLFTIYDIMGKEKEAQKNLLKAYELFPNHPKYKLVKEAFIKDSK